VAVRLLAEHLRHCVAGAADPSNERDLDEMIGEAAGAIQRLMKV
jgi:DNA-binding FrmR family transcriptional regulator